MKGEYAFAYITAEEFCPEMGSARGEVAEIMTSDGPIVSIDPSKEMDQFPDVAEYPLKFKQNARNMLSGQTYKLCVDADGVKITDMKYGWAKPHTIFVSPVLTCQRTIFARPYGVQTVVFGCPNYGCYEKGAEAGYYEVGSEVYFEKYLPERSNQHVCNTPS